MKRILWLASWYPTRLDPLTGDFIERHAQAASQLDDVWVFHVVKDNSGHQKTNCFVETKTYHAHCRASICYYRTGNSPFSFWEKLRSNWLYLRHYRRMIRSYIREQGKPDLIHVHIALKAGIPALLAKWFYGIPYVVSEQWTGLCPEAKPNLDQQPFLFRQAWKWVMRGASGWTAVSDYLGRAIQGRFALSPCRVIPNVVDTRLFYPGPAAPGPFRFIHISLLNYQKNPELLLEATAKLREISRMPFRLVVVGHWPPQLKQLAEKLALLPILDLIEPCPQLQLADQMRQCHTLILCSRFETFGCVIIEANACGLPVIVSDIPVLRENTQPGVTGVLVPPGRANALAEAMRGIMEDDNAFDSPGIVRLTGDKYSYPPVAASFHEFYETISR
jgi:glycosyltransferase involved in cell wall biosynthesis